MKFFRLSRSPSPPPPQIDGRPLRIVEFTRIHTLHGNIGGMQRHSHNLCAAWAADGHDVRLVTTPKRPHPLQKANTVTVDDGQLKGTEYAVHYTDRSAPKRWTKEFYGQALEIIRELKPDVVHCESASYGSGAPAFYEGLRESGIPVFTTFHSCTWDRMRMFLNLSRFQGVHPEIQEEIAVYEKKLKRLHEMHLNEVKLCDANDGLIALSELFYREFRNNFFQPANKLRKIYLGIDLERFQPVRRKKRAPGDPLRLLFVGRFRWDKGIQTLFQSLRLLKAVQANVVLDFVCAGDKPEIRQLAQELEVAEMINWHFDIKHEKVASFYQQADVFINPTYRYTGLDFTTLEALACGCLVVASDIGDMFEDWFAPTSASLESHAGLLCGYKDPQAIADAVVAIASLPYTTFQRVQKNARALAEQHFDMRAIGREYVDQFRQIRPSAPQP